MLDKEKLTDILEGIYRETVEIKKARDPAGLGKYANEIGDVIYKLGREGGAEPAINRELFERAAAVAEPSKVNKEVLAVLEKYDADITPEKEEVARGFERIRERAETLLLDLDSDEWPKRVN